MYISQNIADRIKRLMKVQKISNSQLADDIDNINVNTISQLSKGREISYVSFAKIADYLHCSVDYLLGRTDNPNINDNSIKTGDVKGINVKGDTSVTISETPKEHDTIKQNFIALFDNLSPENQIEVMYFTKQLMKKEK